MAKYPRIKQLEMLFLVNSLSEVSQSASPGMVFCQRVIKGATEFLILE